MDEDRGSSLKPLCSQIDLILMECRRVPTCKLSVWNLSLPSARLLFQLRRTLCSKASCRFSRPHTSNPREMASNLMLLGSMDMWLHQEFHVLDRRLVPSACQRRCQGRKVSLLCNLSPWQGGQSQPRLQKQVKEEPEERLSSLEVSFPSDRMFRQDVRESILFDIIKRTPVVSRGM